jgi:RNA polymerase sigma factor (sigma-70 family)
MLLRVSQRVLHHCQDAEDVCQAAFLLLAKKAASPRWRDSVAGWLFQTAYRLAAKSRVTARRRARREARAQAAAPPDPTADLSVRELQAVLDEEISRLPAHYRGPIVLCCLEGKSRDEAARLLGWTLANVKDRLEHGRERLRGRLARRGVLLGTVLTSAWLLEPSLDAAGFTLLPAATARAARAVAAGQTALGEAFPARVIALAEGVSPTMFPNRIAFVLLISLALALGA